MTASHLKPTTILVIGIAILLLSACGKTAPTHFYILHPMSDAGKTSPVAMNDNISIALSPVKMPEHLNRSQIVTRQSRHQVKVDEFNRWAEPLDSSFTLILAENLSILLDTDKISVLNRLKHTPFDYQISVTVIRFDGQMGGDATLICRWSLYGGKEKTPLTIQRSSITQPIKGDGYQDLVSTLSRILADLSREIADRISASERSS